MILILMVAYRIGVNIVDFIILIFMFVFLCFLSAYRVFVPQEMKCLEEEIVMITGSGHGIGKELALQFGRMGAVVVCMDINEKLNDQTVKQINFEGGDSVGFVCDVSDHEQIKQVSKKIRKLIGDVTILVNNAAIVPCKPFMEYSPEEIERLYSVNVLAHFWTIKEWLPTFLKAGRGHILSMSSLCGTMGMPNLVPYCSSKYAIAGLIEGLIEELRYGNQNPNIKVSRIHPFVVDTGMDIKPQVRFPSINRILSVEECAQAIIQSIRREEEVVFIPNWYYYMTKLSICLPRKVQHAIYDFVNHTVDSTSDSTRQIEEKGTMNNSNGQYKTLHL